ncbi:MAG TPA: tryptophan synthase subunit beta [Bacteroidia bacterium]|nr:tryptophan synthase subunit beta [Bacteroidia bacterium]
MNTSENNEYAITTNGYYGNYGGAYIPELLYNNTHELEKQYTSVLEDPSFKNELNLLLKDYVGRPSPLYFAKNLSEKYKSNIYLKREDLNHTGSHKINNALGQALLAKRLGKKNIIAETGAGQHGVATATVCALLDLECTIFMGEVDIQRQASNVSRMKMLGASIIPACSGTKTLKDATNEAIRYWVNNKHCYYLIGSVVGPHPYPDLVTRFQSIISKEIKTQLLSQIGKADPDYIIACIGGGSNAAGAFFDFIGNKNVKLIGVEAAGKGIHSNHTAATLQVGSPGIIHGSKTYLMQNEDGQILEPYSISAGLDYPGIGPLHAYLNESKKAEYLYATDKESLSAAFELMKLEGIIPALESAHALAVLGELKLKPDDTVVVNLSGRGDKDLDTYLNTYQL